MKTYTYRGHTITPKRDFGTSGFLINGKVVLKGWVVVKGICNVMPGGCWFQSVREARHGIDVIIRTKGNARRFWEIMQPFKYRVGQRANFENGSIQKGRFKATVKNWRIVRIARHAKEVFA